MFRESAVNKRGEALPVNVLVSALLKQKVPTHILALGYQKSPRGPEQVTQCHLAWFLSWSLAVLFLA